MRAGTRKIKYCVAIVGCDAVAFSWWVGDGFRPVAKLAVFAVPAAAKIGVAGADVAVVVAVGGMASAAVGARPHVTSQDFAYSRGPRLAFSFAVPIQLKEKKGKGVDIVSIIAIVFQERERKRMRERERGESRQQMHNH